MQGVGCVTWHLHGLVGEMRDGVGVGGDGMGLGQVGVRWCQWKCGPPTHPPTHPSDHSPSHLPIHPPSHLPSPLSHPLSYPPPLIYHTLPRPSSPPSPPLPTPRTLSVASRLALALISASTTSSWPSFAAMIRAVCPWAVHPTYTAIEYSAREGWGRDTGGVRGQRGGKRWR